MIGRYSTALTARVVGCFISDSSVMGGNENLSTSESFAANLSFSGTGGIELTTGLVMGRFAIIIVPKTATTIIAAAAVKIADR